MRGRGVLLAGAVAVALGLLAGPALADHHLVKIREVYPGDDVVGNHVEFVELQMYAAGQGNFAPAADLVLYGANGASLLRHGVPDAPLQENQRTFLYATESAEEWFSVDADFGASGGNIDRLQPAGGAVCLESNFVAIDCVAWGIVTTNPAFSSAGTPAPAITETNSLQRSAAGLPCPIGLDVADDTNSSLADFALASPTPRPNAAALTGCPDTRFTKTPKKTTTKRKAKFKFTASPPAASFECKLDRKPFKPCTSPFKKRVKPGKHKLKVLAEDEIAPASYRWKVVRD